MNTQSTMPAEVQMAMGRLFRLMSRPFQEGDIEQYEMARKVILDAAEARGMDIGGGYFPNFARDARSVHSNGG